MPKKNRKNRSKRVQTTAAQAEASANSSSNDSMNKPAQLSPYFSDNLPSSKSRSKTRSKTRSRSRSRSRSPPPKPSAPMQIEAPTSKRDPRFIGDGASKMVWVTRSDAEMDSLHLPHVNKVMINAFTSQLLKDRRGPEATILTERMKEQRNEYEFTLMVRDEFPDLIPNVFLITGSMIINPQPRFRYVKDRCYPLPKNAELFHHMIRISDQIIDQGWVYLDMKPGNVGERGGQVLLIDTDPTSFYRIPYLANDQARRQFRNYYRVSCHMIILLFCFNFVKEIPTKILQDFILTKGYTEASFRAIYSNYPMTEGLIASYNNRIAAEGNYPVHVDEEDIMEPKTYIDHYGNFEGIHALTRLQQIIDYKPFASF